VIVLAVDLEARQHQIPQQRHRHQRAVHARARLARRRHVPPQDHLVALRRQGAGLERLQQRGRLHHRLDGALRLSGAEHLRGRTSPQQQRQGVDQDGLPGACLAGQEVEAGTEFDLHGAHHRDVADPEQFKHRAALGAEDNTRLRGL
jgi:hypothetical protein